MNVSEFSVLFPDDPNMFVTGKDMTVLCNQLNEDLRNVQEWLQCNKLSFNVLKTHYIFHVLYFSRLEINWLMILM